MTTTSVFPEYLLPSRPSETPTLAAIILGGDTPCPCSKKVPQFQSQHSFHQRSLLNVFNFSLVPSATIINAPFAATQDRTPNPPNVHCLRKSEQLQGLPWSIQEKGGQTGSRLRLCSIYPCSRHYRNLLVLSIVLESCGSLMGVKVKGLQREQSLDTAAPANLAAGRTKRFEHRKLSLEGGQTPFSCIFRPTLTTRRRSAT